MKPFRPVEVAPDVRVQVFSCPRCKARFRREVRIRYGLAISGARKPYADAARIAPAEFEPCGAFGFDFELVCACGARLSNTNSNPAAGLFGVTYSWLSWRDRGDGGHKCDARCRTARGTTCECSCNGKNHGAEAVA